MTKLIPNRERTGDLHQQMQIQSTGPEELQKISRNARPFRAARTNLRSWNLSNPTGLRLTVEERRSPTNLILRRTYILRSSVSADAGDLRPADGPWSTQRSEKEEAQGNLQEWELDLKWYGIISRHMLFSRDNEEWLVRKSS
jgi:hypothetical protein